MQNGVFVVLPRTINQSPPNLMIIIFFIVLVYT